MLQMYRQAGQIRLIAGEHHFMHRCGVGGNFDDRLFGTDAAGYFFGRNGPVHAKGEADPCAIT